MSAHRLDRNFQQFLQTIYSWPRDTIEKNVLIEMLEAFSRKNPELQGVYYDAIELPATSDPSSGESDPPAPVKTAFTAKRDYRPLPAIPSRAMVIKEGDLRMKKGSSMYSSLSKNNGVQLLHCELSVIYQSDDKRIYFTLYRSRKHRTILHSFLLDATCAFVHENKRDFSLKHTSGVESFTTETGLADSWTEAFHRISADEVYENPDDDYLIYASLESSVPDPPARPPPRPSRFTKPICPENIYVCLYDHQPTTQHGHELDFQCGDLLYVMHTSDSNFYVGYKLTVPWDHHDQHQPVVGLVFKDYIRAAYEQVP